MIQLLSFLVLPFHLLEVHFPIHMFPHYILCSIISIGNNKVVSSRLEDPIAFFYHLSSGYKGRVRTHQRINCWFIYYEIECVILVFHLSDIHHLINHFLIPFLLPNFVHLINNYARNIVIGNKMVSHFVQLILDSAISTPNIENFALVIMVN